MKIQVIKQLPVKYEGGLAQHPEPLHLQQIYEAALKLGKDALLIEDGPTNGAVTYALMTAMKSLPGSRLIIIGTQTPELQALIQRHGTGLRVEFNTRVDVWPSLYFVGRPSDVRQSVDQALALDCRLIFVYDVRRDERYSRNARHPDLRLPCFKANAEAAALLRAHPTRHFTEISLGVSFQQCRRGMAVSEARGWKPGPVVTWGQIDQLLIDPPKSLVEELLQTTLAGPPVWIAAEEPDFSTMPTVDHHPAPELEGILAADPTPEAEESDPQPAGGQMSAGAWEAARAVGKKRAKFKKKHGRSDIDPATGPE